MSCRERMENTLLSESALQKDWLSVEEDEHLAQYQVENPEVRIREIIEAMNVLEYNPLIGRPANNGKRELVIGRSSHGYMALYSYIIEIDAFFPAWPLT